MQEQSHEAAQDFSVRLQSLREEAALSQKNLADHIGVSLTSIQKYEKGQLPRSAHAVALAKVLGCSIDWLLTGKESSFGTGKQDDMVLVPMVRARLSAGGGSFETHDTVIRHYAFRWDFLHRKGSPATMVLLRVTGDSMQPQILNNDVVLIDQSQINPMPGHIYAVSFEDMVYLKVVDAMPGKLILSSINPDYAPIHIGLAESTQEFVRIIGRAVWVGREL